MTLGYPGWRRMGLAFGLGLGVALGQAPLGWWPVAMVALVLLVVGVFRAENARQAAWLAWAGGVGHFGLSLSWIVSPFFVEPEVYGWMAPFALILMAAGMALFWAGAGAASRLTRHRGLGFAVALAGFEALRGVIFTGFPWAMLAHMWVDTPIAFLAAVIGVNGMNLMTLLVAASFTVVRKGAGWAAVAVVAACGAASLMQGMAEPGPERMVSLRLVQPAIAQDLKWDAEAARANFDRLLELTALAPVADLTIWPETAVPYLLDRQPEVGQMMAVATGGRALLVGYQRVEGPQGWNSLGLVGPDGTVTQSYDKAHLVPFGEYIPFGDFAYDWFGLQAFASQLGAAYSAGPGPAVMDLGPYGVILPLICYEAIFPAFVNAAPQRADWILQITNDAWFGTLTGPWQHVAQVRFRAIEQGLPVVRVANTGVTAVYDAHGRVVAELMFGKAGVLDIGSIPGALPPTIYSRWGEILFLLLLAGVAAGLVLFRKPKGA
ncbi:MAG: apolipoprotein N-acyltransferase [Rhodobacteraceae bacterium]|nr:apolipoprotein N-acyltransferase [Paracoccaceae bacterium]